MHTAHAWLTELARERQTSQIDYGMQLVQGWVMMNYLNTFELFTIYQKSMTHIVVSTLEYWLGSSTSSTDPALL
jgi:hypothetical protein